MGNETLKDKERFFSVELKSKADLKSITLGNGSGDCVLVEGSIGGLVQATFVEGLILEITGRKGVLRINLEKDELTEEKLQCESAVGQEVKKCS